MTKLRVDALSKFVAIDPLSKIKSGKIKRVAKAVVFGKSDVDAAEKLGIAPLVQNVSFSLPAGGAIAIMGDPGSGKTALIDMLGGFEKPTLGSIWLDEQKLSGLSGHRGMAMRRAEIRTVSVQDRLFPHLNVRENLELAAKLASGKAVAVEKTRELIEAFDLGLVAEKLPQKLTLHETRRSLIAQSLTGSPKVLLIGGLFDGLPGSEREELFERLARLRREHGFSLVVTTEDAGIALGVADEMLMLSGSEALQSGPSLDVILEPTDERVREALAKADLSDVMEAEALMQMPTVIQLGSTITENSLRSVEAGAVKFAAVIDEDYAFVGLVSLGDLKRGMEGGGDLTKKIQTPVSVAANTRVKIVGRHLLEQDLPVAVLGEEKALQGLVSRLDLMKMP